MLYTLLSKLIKTSTGRGRFVLATIGLSIAMLLILAAVQLQANYNQLLSGKTNKDSIANFLLINKNINTVSSGNTSLKEEEINDLKKQAFVDAVGVLTPSRFKVSATSVSDQVPFYSDLFLESVPDEFLDVNNPDWNWGNQNTFIPIIIPNMFLDMYNFGFAVSQGTPQLSQEAIKTLQLRINIGSGINATAYPARVVGFSDRISSVLVPQSFMDWANNKFGSADANAKSSRVVIKTKDAGNPALTKYLREHNLATDADKTRFSKYRTIVNAVVSISWVTGAVMLLFALLVFTLFIQLTISACRSEIDLLITLGAAPKQLYLFLMKRFFPPNIIIIILVLVIISILQFIIQGVLQKQAIEINSFISVFTLLAGLLVLTVLWLVNSLTIKAYIRENYKG